jgi:hypothetical protein
MDCQSDLVVNNFDLNHFVNRHKEGVLVFVFSPTIYFVAIFVFNNFVSYHHIHFIHYHNSFDKHLTKRFILDPRIMEELFVFCLNYYLELFCYIDSVRSFIFVSF